VIILVSSFLTLVFYVLLIVLLSPLVPAAFASVGLLELSDVDNDRFAFNNCNRDTITDLPIRRCGSDKSSSHRNLPSFDINWSFAN
jgi:hypothetical protein